MSDKKKEFKPVFDGSERARVSKFFYGVGYIGDGDHSLTIDGKKTDSYAKWHSMLQRCYDKQPNRKLETYIDCAVSEEWKDYQCFAEWLVNNPYYGNGYELDKDLLVKGNRVYSAETCCLIPSAINMLLICRNSIKRNYPMGVSRLGGTDRFVAKISVSNKSVHLGVFLTVEDARNAYVTAKENYVKTKALEWRGMIDDRAFDALMTWEVQS